MLSSWCPATTAHRQNTEMVDFLVKELPSKILSHLNNEKKAHFLL